MKVSNILFLLTFLSLVGACSVHRNSDMTQDNKTDTSTVQVSKAPAEKYVLVLDELVSNGCDISIFEMVERSKALDMKVACK